MPNVVFSGAAEAKKDLADLSRQILAKLRPLTQHYGMLVQRDVQNRARQLFDVTDYDQTIELRMAGKDNNPAAIITSRAPQAHRLEFGFFGVDATGRSLHQAPKPHFRPALARYGPRYAESIRALFE